MLKFDIVLPHVNFNDINWQNQYKQYFKEFNYNRHRAEINLKYLFRSINDNIDFVNNIYLVVSSETQVYDWINRDKVKIILHKDIIPEEFLPTFNSSCIEMFIHKIPGLSEEFIYFNDDTFVTNNKKISDYLINNCSNFQISEEYKRLGTIIANNRCNDLILAQKLTNKIYDKNVIEINGDHHSVLFFKKDYEYVYNQLKDELHKRITKVRTSKNTTQRLFRDYIILTNKWCANTDTYTKKKFTRIKTEKDLINLKSILFNPNITDVCVNYVAEQFIPQVNELFEQKFPNKSIYEL